MPQATGRLHDRVAVITGGAAGIGAAMVRMFVDEGGKVGVYDQITFDTTIASAVWAADRREIRASDGETFTSRAIISTLGGLHTPSKPDLPGADEFEGLRFHTTDWPDDLDLTGKRVAVIGTGATAVQIAALSPTQASVDAFTRNVRDRFGQTTHSKGCTSWWSEATGHNHRIWPGSCDLLATLDLEDFDVVR